MLQNIPMDETLMDRKLPPIATTRPAQTTASIQASADCAERLRGGGHTQRCVKNHERLSVDDPPGISADFAAICRRVSKHPILVLPSVFPIDE